jgi:predicted RNase H-like nuclease (RuvC/YqgF family)
MTDDLVKRLRERQEFEFIDGHKRVEWEDEDALIAADRIEELQKQLAASDKQIKDLEDEIENLEYEMCEMENRS